MRSRFQGQWTITSSNRNIWAIYSFSLCKGFSQILDGFRFQGHRVRVSHQSYYFLKKLTDPLIYFTTLIFKGNFDDRSFFFWEKIISAKSVFLGKVIQFSRSLNYHIVECFGMTFFYHFTNLQSISFWRALQINVIPPCYPPKMSKDLFIAVTIAIFVPYIRSYWLPSRLGHSSSSIIWLIGLLQPLNKPIYMEWILFVEFRIIPIWISDQIFCRTCREKIAMIDILLWSICLPTKIDRRYLSKFTKVYVIAIPLWIA